MKSINDSGYDLKLNIQVQINKKLINQKKQNINQIVFTNMLVNRSILNKQRLQSSQPTTTNQPQSNNPIPTQLSISPFTPPPNYLQLPLQMTFRQQLVDEERYIRELLQGVQVREGVSDDEERVGLLKIDELDQLVDFMWREWVVGECLKEKIREEIEEIWLGEIGQINYQDKYSEKQDNSNRHIIITQPLSGHPTIQPPTIQQLLTHTNHSTTHLIHHIQTLTSQNHHLTQQSLTQHHLLTQKQSELHQIKDKYLSVLKEFTIFKKQAQSKQLTLSQCLQRKQVQLVGWREKVKKLEEEREGVEQRVMEMKQKHQQQVKDVSQKMHQYYSLELLHFIAIINGLIVDSQKPLVTLIDTNNFLPNQQTLTQLKPQDFSSQIELSPSTSIHQTYHQKLNQISTQLDSFLQQKFTLDHQLITKQSVKIKQLKDGLRQSHELIKEVNTLSEYELKVEKKDLKLSEMSKSSNMAQTISDEETFELIEEIVEVMKKHILDQETSQIQDLPLKKEIISELLTSKKQQFHKSKKCSHSRQQSMSQKQSPIQMLNHNQQSEKLSVNKSTHQLDQLQKQNQVQEFNVQDEEISTQVIEKYFEQVNKSSRKSINKTKQFQLLKLQNQSLKEQLQIIKAEIDQNLTTQKRIQIQSKPSTQRIGKIKKTSTNNSPNNLQPTTTNPQSNKQNLIRQSNKLLQPIQQQSTTIQKCSNLPCKQLTKKLQTKLNQYKQNIINLNQIINYFINHLKGYHFANITTREKDNRSLEKRITIGKKMNQLSVFDGFGNTLPVRKYSYLDDQLESINRQQQSTKYNFRLNTNQSFNQTVKSTVLSQKINSKQVGKITSTHQSLNNTQMLPIIKPHLSQQQITAQTNKFEEKRSKFISIETLRTNFENFEFIRKLCLKQVKCKDLIAKFHSYLDFYFEKIEEMHPGILDWKNENEMDVNDTIELENMCNIWQYEEIPTFEPQQSQNTSNYGLKVRSLNSSHPISRRND